VSGGLSGCFIFGIRSGPAGMDFLQSATGSILLPRYAFPGFDTRSPLIFAISGLFPGMSPLFTCIRFSHDARDEVCPHGISPRCAEAQMEWPWVRGYFFNHKE